MRPSANHIVLINRLLTRIGYIAYPLLLIFVALSDIDLLLRLIIVPAISFALVSMIRYIINAPRPYEVTGNTPLIAKSTKGKSFPSRHIFCMFMIAGSWFIYNAYVGMALALCGCIMAWLRVKGGVHFARDVIAGAVAAILCCAIGYYLIPW